MVPRIASEAVTAVRFVDVTGLCESSSKKRARGGAMAPLRRIWR
jgi:hypothetical protein